MPVHNFSPLNGRILQFRMDSKSLKGNLLGDPSQRTVSVYLPPGANRTSSRFPLMVYLAPFGSSGLTQVSWRQFGETIPQRVERLVASGKMGEVIVALPDCFTSLGGNQYVNSPILGLWEDFLAEELLSELAERAPVADDPRHRAIVGYSSGGYGSLVQGMRHSSRWAALACHSGDMGFENLFRGAIPRVVTALQEFNLSIERFLDHLRRSPKISSAQFETLLLIAMAASYDPGEGGPAGIRLPVDLQTCALIPERWRNWLRHDPLQMIDRPECQESLKKLKMIYIDCGNSDEYHLHYGGRLFSGFLTRAEIPHLYEEFQGDHRGIDHRLDRSLPLLYRAIALDE